MSSVEVQYEHLISKLFDGKRPIELRFTNSDTP